MTFVQVQDALALYPLFAFLAVRFAISTLALAPFAWKSPGRFHDEATPRGSGWACSSRLPTACRRRARTHRREYRVHHRALRRLHAAARSIVFGTPVPRALWAGVALAVVGLLLLNGVPGGSAGNALVLGNAVFQAFQITAMERYAPRYDPRALTFLQMATSFAGFAVIAVALGELEVPRGATVWGRSS